MCGFGQRHSIDRLRSSTISVLRSWLRKRLATVFFSGFFPNFGKWDGKVQERARRGKADVDILLKCLFGKIDILTEFGFCMLFFIFARQNRRCESSSYWCSLSTGLVHCPLTRWAVSCMAFKCHSGWLLTILLTYFQRHFYAELQFCLNSIHSPWCCLNGNRSMSSFDW